MLRDALREFPSKYHTFSFNALGVIMVSGLEPANVSPDDAILLYAIGFYFIIMVIIVTASCIAHNF